MYSLRIKAAFSSTGIFTDRGNITSPGVAGKHMQKLAREQEQI
jgi:hypothetical protein